MNVFLFKWLLAVGALVGAVVWFFSTDALQVIGDSGRSLLSTQSDRSAAPDANIEQATYRLDPETNNIRNVSVTGLAIHKLPAGRLGVDFDLVSAGGSNDFPDLRLEFHNAAGGVVRSDVVPAASYTHSRILTRSRVSLEVPLLGQESSLIVRPFYPARSPSAAAP